MLLGVDAATGGRIRWTKTRSRMSAGEKKAVRFLRFKKSRILVSRIRATVERFVLYGARVVGTPTSILTRLRSLVRKGSSARGAGASATMDFATMSKHKADPAFAADAAPIAGWATEWASGLGAKRALLSAAWTKHFDTMTSATSHGDGAVWKDVCGPAGALAATMTRIGWTASLPSRWKSHKGLDLNLDQIGPRSIRALCHQATDTGFSRRANLLAVCG